MIRNARTLLRDRHLDHILICTIYSVCRVAGVEPEVTFASIIECFRHCFLESVQRSWSSSTMGFAVDVTIIRDVATPEATAAVAVAATAKADASNGTTPLLQGKRHGDILHFYNLVFVPMLEVSVFEILCWGETCDWRCRAPFFLCASRAPKEATTLFLTPVPCSLHCSLLFSPPPPHTPPQSHLLRFYHIDVFGGRMGNPRPPSCVTIPNPAHRLGAVGPGKNVFLSPRRAGVRHSGVQNAGVVTYSFGESPSTDLKSWKEQMTRLKRVGK